MIGMWVSGREDINIWFVFLLFMRYLNVNELFFLKWYDLLEFRIKYIGSIVLSVD